MVIKSYLLRNARYGEVIRIELLETVSMNVGAKRDVVIALFQDSNVLPIRAHH